MNEIVVGLDGSAASIDALRWAEAIAGPDTVVRAVYAYVYPVGIAGDVATMPAYPISDLEHVADQVLAAATAQVPEGEVRRETRAVMAASPTAGLLDEAEGADLLVVGTRAHSTTDRILLGSVALRCAQHSPCPFVGVPEAPRRGDGTIAVAYDGSDTARTALAWAASVADARDAPLRVIAVWERPGQPAKARLDLAGLPVDDRAEIRLAESVASVVGGDAARSMDLRAVEADGSVADHLIAESEGTDLMVTGSRGRGGFRGLLLGSVSQRLLENSPVPVAVIRPG